MVAGILFLNVHAKPYWGRFPAHAKASMFHNCSFSDTDLWENYVKKYERYVTEELVQRQMMKLIALLSLRDSREVSVSSPCMNIVSCLALRSAVLQSAWKVTPPPTECHCCFVVCWWFRVRISARRSAMLPELFMVFLHASRQIPV
jgi:hypothetical protein